MFSKLYKQESGITALETAIILIAFVVVAAVFAFTILSAGTFSTEKGKEAIYAGLEEVSSSMELRGSIIGSASTTGTSGTVGTIELTVGNVAGGSPIDLTDTSTGTNKLVIGYIDNTTTEPALTWSVDWAVRHDSDEMLEDGELARITIVLGAKATSTSPYTATSGVSLGPDTEFMLELKPPRGAVLSFEKSTPSYIDPVMVFNQ